MSRLLALIKNPLAMFSACLVLAMIFQGITNARINAELQQAKRDLQAAEVVRDVAVQFNESLNKSVLSLSDEINKRQIYTDELAEFDSNLSKQVSQAIADIKQGFVNDESSTCESQRLPDDVINGMRVYYGSDNRNP